jgi:hypothetical protein
MSDLVSTDYCTCNCHEPGVTMMHVVQCCSRCPYCEERVTNLEHRERCPKRPGQRKPRHPKVRP